MKKFKFPFFMLAFCIALAASFAFSVPQKAEGNLVDYHYDSDSYELEDLQNIDNWEATGPACDVIGDLPCVVPFNGTRGEFETALSGLDEEEILNMASEKRTPIP